MRKYRVTSILALAISICGAAPSALAASTSTEACVSSSYGCTTDSYSGSEMFYSGSYLPSTLGHNCTVYAAYKMSLYKVFNARYRNLGDASNWAISAALIPGVVVSHAPHVNDVAQWNWGHVGWVESVTTNTSGVVTGIIVTDDNFGRNVTTRKLLYVGGNQGSATWPDNFITFPALGSGSGKPWQFQIAPIASTGN